MILSCIKLTQNSHQTDIFFLAPSMYILEIEDTDLLSWGQWQVSHHRLVGVSCTDKAYKSHTTRNYLSVVMCWEWQGSTHTHGNFTIFLCIHRNITCSCVWVQINIHGHAWGGHALASIVILWFCFLLTFWDGVSYWTWKLFYLARLVVQQCLSIHSLCLDYGYILSTIHKFDIDGWVLTQVFMLMKQVLYWVSHLSSLDYTFSLFYHSLRLSRKTNSIHHLDSKLNASSGKDHAMLYFFFSWQQLHWQLACLSWHCLKKSALSFNRTVFPATDFSIFFWNKDRLTFPGFTVTLESWIQNMS
jgi:hypothetical protein